MGQLVFTPWYNVVQQVAVGPYELKPFNTRQANVGFGTLEPEAKAILKNYLTTPFTSAVKTPPLREFPVENTTLILSNTSNPADDLERLQYIQK